MVGSLGPVDATDRDDRLYFRQLPAGRDFARTDPVARQMVNFVYLIGDRATGEALVVDPAYDVAGCWSMAPADDMRITGALVTHYHPDHVGGEMMGLRIDGVESLLAAAPVPVHVQADEAPWVTRVTGVSQGDLVTHASGDVVRWARSASSWSSPRGNTPGSQCFFVDGRYLVSGDTLFLEGCGAHRPARRRPGPAVRGA